MRLLMGMVFLTWMFVSSLCFASSQNVNNKICPVSEDVVGGAMGKPYPMEHDGKIYNLCCKMCAKDFKKDPDQYVRKVEAMMSSQKSGGSNPEENDNHSEHF